MTVEELRSRLHGVLGFPVTPFRQDLSLDLDALERNVAEMAEHSFCAIVAAGGAGEMYSLAPEEHVEVMRVAVHAAAGKLPVIAGVGSSAALASQLARRFELLGAAGLLVFPPYYVSAPEAGLLGYYRSIEAATALPLVLYARDWAAFSPETALRLADALPALAAWKDGQGDLRRFERIMTRLGGRLAWIGGAGDDLIPAYVSIGVRAFTSSISSIAPKLSAALGAAAGAGDAARLDILMRKYVYPLFALRDRSRGYEVAVTKAAMEILGRRAGPVRPPLAPLTERDLEELRRLMEGWADIDGARI